MSYILTFVASDLNAHPLSQSFLSFLKDEGFNVEKITWLHPKKALDINSSQKLSHSNLSDLRHKLTSQKIDVFFTEEKSRKKKLLLADMDSTIVVDETLDELADFAGVKDQVEEITTRAMNNEFDFEEALYARVRLLKNLPISALDETLSAIQIMPGAKYLVSEMKKNGGKSVLVTGGFTHFSDQIGQEVKFDHVHGNTLEIKDSLLTGNVIPPVLDKNSKLSYLKKYASHYEIELSETMAIGDGANDLLMLEAAGLGIGYRPKELLKKKLINVILHGDLTSALYAQGYKNFES